MVNELAEGMDARSLFRAYWGTFLYANVGEEWGIIQGTGYKKHENGQRIVDPSTGIICMKTIWNLDQYYLITPEG